MNAPLSKEQLALLMSDNLTYRTNAVQTGAATLPQARPSTLAQLARRVSGAVAALLSYPRRRAVIDELSSLTDRELADIGLTRDELKLVFDPKFRSTYRG